MASSDLLSHISLEELAGYCLHHPEHFATQFSQTKHRAALLASWPITKGARILELGGGQGDFTAVLAAAVGPDGHVTAVDPGPADYGRPFTLAQAQGHLSAGPLGARITWVRADPLDYLASPAASQPFDFAVLANSLWYFAAPPAITATLRALAARVPVVCVAEWALRASTPGAGTHVLAALAQAALECRKPASTSNVRTVVAPAAIAALATDAGLRVAHERYVTPALDVADGKWEVMAVRDAAFLAQVDAAVADPRERGVVVALRDAVLSSLEHGGGMKNVAPMDVWCAVLQPQEQL